MTAGRSRSVGFVCEVTNMVGQSIGHPLVERAFLRGDEGCSVAFHQELSVKQEVYRPPIVGRVENVNRKAILCGYDTVLLKGSGYEKAHAVCFDCPTFVLPQFFQPGVFWGRLRVRCYQP